jgi:16S rRNA (uracil1498-N3)-methyltransferase
MHRFFLPDPPGTADPLRLTGHEAAHAARVLRLKPGDPVTVLDGQGARYLGRLSAVTRNNVALRVEQVERVDRPTIELTLFQAITKPKSMDWIVEKATELGVHRIQPVITERVVTKLGETGEPRKREKWKRTAIEALKQCGGAWLPAIELPRRLTDLLETGNPPSLQVVSCLDASAPPVRRALDGLNQTGSLPARVGAWVGPEGDFTSEELSQLTRAGAIPVTLGRQVLRSETAAVCLLALLSHELTSWDPPRESHDAPS